VRIFRDPAGSNWVGGILEVPDVASFEAAMKTDEAAEAMKFDGLRPETLVTLVEA